MSGRSGFDVVSDDDAARALIMAAWYDRQDVVRFLLDHGVPAGTRLQNEGNTALHVATCGGNASLVPLLLERGAPIDATDDVYGTPPLVWGLHGWPVDGRADDDAHRAVLRSCNAALSARAVTP